MRNHESTRRPRRQFISITCEDAILELDDSAQVRLTIERPHHTGDACSETEVANLTGFNSLQQKSNQLIGRMVSSGVVVQQIKIDIIGPKFAKANLQVPASVRNAESITL